MRKEGTAILSFFSYSAMFVPKLSFQFSDNSSLKMLLRTLHINDNLNMYINDHLRMYTSDYALI